MEDEGYTKARDSILVEIDNKIKNITEEIQAMIYHHDRQRVIKENITLFKTFQAVNVTDFIETVIDDDNVQLENAKYYENKRMKEMQLRELQTLKENLR